MPSVAWRRWVAVATGAMMLLAAVPAFAQKARLSGSEWESLVDQRFGYDFLGGFVDIDVFESENFAVYYRAGDFSETLSREGLQAFHEAWAPWVPPLPSVERLLAEGVPAFVYKLAAQLE